MTSAKTFAIVAGAVPRSLKQPFSFTSEVCRPQILVNAGTPQTLKHLQCRAGVECSGVSA